MTEEEKYRDKVKKILTKPAGRKALKEFGIDVEIADPEKEKEQPIVAVLVPTYRAPDPQMADSLRLAVQHARESGATVYSGPAIQASVVHWSRNMLITGQIKSGKPWTHALLCDDDMKIPADAITKLLSHKKDIIGGMCTRRNDPPVPTIRHLDMGTGVYEQIWEWPLNHTFEVGGIGAAFLLVTRHTFEQIAQAYFDCLWEKDFYHVDDEWVAKHKARRLDHFDKTGTAFWFRFLPAQDQPIEMGEDMSFCMVAKKYCGLSIWCDSSVHIGHVGTYPYSVNDFFPYQKALIEEAKKNGRFHEFAVLDSEAPAPSFHVTYEEPVSA